MSDIVELKNGQVVYKAYSTATGVYHSEALVKMINKTVDRRGKAINVLKAALPKDSPLRDMTVDELSKVQLK